MMDENYVHLCRIAVAIFVKEKTGGILVLDGHWWPGAVCWEINCTCNSLSWSIPCCSWFTKYMSMCAFAIGHLGVPQNWIVILTEFKRKVQLNYTVIRVRTVRNSITTSSEIAINNHNVTSITVKIWSRALVLLVS